jgi:hypothetical protein
MEWIGDLERAFATSLNPLRVPIAIGMVIALVALALVARRRGWLGAARRHPGRTSVLILAVIAVGGPVAWYLGSPLFIETSLVEPAPTGVVASPTPAPVPATAAPATVVPTRSDPSAAATTPPETSTPSRTGTFTGADDFHFGRGTARLIETEPGTWVVRFEDFAVRNGPDLYVYLSPDGSGYDDAAVELGKLKATTGAFNMAVPGGTDVTTLRSVVIWCKQFAVEFAVAPLS